LNTPQIFSDPTGRRKLLIGLLATVLLFLLVVIASAFFFSLRNRTGGRANLAILDSTAPVVPKPGTSPIIYSTRRAPVSNQLLESYRQDSLEAIEKTEKQQTAKKAGARAASPPEVTPPTSQPELPKIVVGFYAP